MSEYGGFGGEKGRGEGGGGDVWGGEKGWIGLLVETLGLGQDGGRDEEVMVVMVLVTVFVCGWNSIDRLDGGGFLGVEVKDNFDEKRIAMSMNPAVN